MQVTPLGAALINIGIAGLLLGVAAITWRWWLRIFGILVVPENKLGIVNKKFVLWGRNATLPDGKIIALNGEAGWQADTLAPGLHFWYWPWQYEVRLEDFTKIPQGKLGLVQAADGHPISQGRVLGRTVESDSFQSARAFLAAGGERGPQLAIIPPGLYRINTALFGLTITEAYEVPQNSIAIVTTKEGKALPLGDIAGREIAGHDSYQNPQAFVDGGGFKGLQVAPLLPGRYFLNPMFVSAEQKPLTDVPIAYVGVVIAYVGDVGVDTSGEAFKHGNIVSQGQKGVWSKTLDPGKYPINPYTHKVELVPTANVVLNWATGKSEAHNLDKNLSTITVRSYDGFSFNLDVSQIIHIPATDAAKVIARFGSVLNLVTQVLEPTIGNYFRNAAQSSDVIDFLKERTKQQSNARESIGKALSEYNVGAVDTLIGDIVPPEQLMKTLTDRKVAQQETITYDTQRLAQVQRKELAQAQALADTQPRVVDAERAVAIADFQAQASIKQAEGTARSKTLNAEADASVITLTGTAEAGKVRAVGTAEADVIRLKVSSIEPGNYARIEVARELAKSGKLVPDILAGGSGEGGGLVSVMLANTVRDQLTNGHARDAATPAPKETK